MWILALLACGGLFGITPSVDQLEVTPDRCGRWQAVIEASGDGEQVELFADGFPVGSWTVQGYGQAVTATGASGPSRTLVFEARMAGSVQQEIVVMPSLDGTVTLSPKDATFAEGTAPQLAVSLTTVCPAGSALWTAQASGGWHGQGVVAAPGVPTKILLPKQPRGRQTLQVDVTVGGSPVGTSELVFYVGDPDDDLDRDGYIGGVNGDDCDDRDRRVHPRADEGTVANLRDDDCDGTIDEGTTAYDDDGDGIVEDDGDCDDNDPGMRPGAREVANCRDEDCDGEVDEGTTLVERDDVYDPNDSKTHSYDLRTNDEKSFRQDVTVVTRDVDDVEWFTFYSQDGGWDSWGVVATVSGIPDGAAYDLEIWDAPDGLLRTTRVTSRGESAEIAGNVLGDDSGMYWVRIAPARIQKAWCPLTVEISGR